MDNLLDCYRNTPDKDKASFIQFNIENCYLSITSDLLHNAILFVKEVKAVLGNYIHIFLTGQEKLYFFLFLTYSY